MKLRKLARLCEHDKWERHNTSRSGRFAGTCPGGEFLPEGALVIEKIDGKYIVRPIPWPQWANPIVSLLNILASHDALADQVGEPG